MWDIESVRADDRTFHWRCIRDSDCGLSFAQVIRSWRTDAVFRASWNAGLREVPFAAYCWECPPVHEANRDLPFECVFIASPSLARMPVDPGAFAEHFRPGCSTVTFGNLGGDAVLVAPCPAADGRNFGHLAQFIRTAAPEQQDALWQSVGEAMGARVNINPVWLSTAGHGVAWLHVRLDSQPKYYRHDAYRRGTHDGR